MFRGQRTLLIPVAVAQAGPIPGEHLSDRLTDRLRRYLNLFGFTARDVDHQLVHSRIVLLEQIQRYLGPSEFRRIRAL